MGRKLLGSLSPFLCIGVSFASFRVSGKLPDSKHLFIISVSGGARLAAQAFTSFGDILSNPEDVFDDSDCRWFQVWILVRLFNSNVLFLLSLLCRKCLKSYVGFNALSLSTAAVL